MEHAGLDSDGEPSGPGIAPRGDDVAECRRLLHQATERYRSGALGPSVESVLRAADLARQAGRSDLLAESALVVVGVEDPVLDAAIIGLCRDAIAAVSPDDAPLQARLRGQLAVALYHRGALAEAVHESQIAMDLAVRADDAAATAAALHARQTVAQGLGHAAELVELGDRMLDVAATTRSTEYAMLGSCWRIEGLMLQADAPAASMEIDALEVLAARTGDQLVAWHALRSRAGWCQAVGRLDEAERLAALARDVVASAEGHELHSLYYAQITLISIDRGVRSPLGSRVGTSAAGGPPIIRATLGKLELACGDRAAARASFEAIKPRLAALPRDERWFPTTVGALELAVAFDDDALAETLRAELEPFDGLMIAGSVGAHDPVAYYLGLVESHAGRLDAAIAHFEAATELLARGDLEPSLTRTRVALAHALIRRAAAGDRGRAETLAAIAAADARNLGMLGLLPVATAILDELAQPRGRLSPREREIAGHVAAGRSNRDIALELVISERTVETHIQNILIKLEFHSRAQIAAWAAIQKGRDRRS
jgi:DNA-binding CsgD family transcriptional regulator